MARPPAIAILAILLSTACKDEDIVWVPFNADDQTLVVEVVEAEPGGVLTLELVSNLGLTEVGSATIDPGSGPVGTMHAVTVEVFDQFEAIVGRATVTVETEAVDDLDEDGDIESRGEGEFELRRDSADPGAYAVTLQSLGADGEEREDQFTIQLWQPEELATGVEPTE